MRRQFVQCMLRSVTGTVTVTSSAGAIMIASYNNPAGVGSSALHTPSASIHTTSPLLMRKFKGRRPVRRREAQEGDWQCQCGETNYKSKRECFKCGAPAPALPPGVRRPSLPGEDPNDWACPCGQMNFRGSVNCYKCKQPKPAPVDAQPVTMWNCGKCRSINRGHRKHCFKCFSPPPIDTPPTPMTSAPTGGSAAP